MIDQLPERDVDTERVPTPNETTLSLLTDGDISPQDAYLRWEGDLDEFVTAVQDAGIDISACDDCGEFDYSYDLQETGDRRVICDECGDNYCRCYWCEVLFRNTTTAGDEEWCEECLYAHHSYCEECNEWISDEDSDHSHSRDSDCAPTRRRFVFPAHGAGTIGNDERLGGRTLPAGLISDEGMELIKSALYCYLDGTDQGLPSYVIANLLDEAGHMWQTSKGNFPRRVSSAFYKYRRVVYKSATDVGFDGVDTVPVKLDNGILSAIGNIAREHSSKGSTFLRGVDQGPQPGRRVLLPRRVVLVDRVC